jgi:DNA-binding MarR family transcriptional regulator
MVKIVSELIEKVVKDVSPKTCQFKVLAYLAFKGPSQPSTISEETDIPAGTVRPSLRTLLDKGYVIQLEDGSYKSLVPFPDIISHLYSLNQL